MYTAYFLSLTIKDRTDSQQKEIGPKYLEKLAWLHMTVLN